MLVEAEEERMVEEEQWWKKQEMRQVERKMVGERKQILNGHGFRHERVQKSESALHLSTVRKGLSTDDSRQSSYFLDCGICRQQQRDLSTDHTVPVIWVLHGMRLSTALGWLSTGGSNNTPPRQQLQPLGTNPVEETTPAIATVSRHERVQKSESALHLSTARKGLSTDDSRQSSYFMECEICRQQQMDLSTDHTVPVIWVLHGMSLSTALGWLSTGGSNNTPPRQQLQPLGTNPVEETTPAIATVSSVALWERALRSTGVSIATSVMAATSNEVLGAAASLAAGSATADGHSDSAATALSWTSWAFPRMGSPSATEVDMKEERKVLKKFFAGRREKLQMSREAMSESLGHRLRQPDERGKKRLALIPLVARLTGPEGG
ncbi:hypothetical protein Taro_001768 [Colocasia esculenta]|uniref:Uncharacterized protein n=1 Tax=Colocasia esculenta TaxID=4460 RepID=A0A843TJV6_COLES|nr:hypothetical protein [Colocasia esculenta]